MTRSVFSDIVGGQRTLSNAVAAPRFVRYVQVMVVLVSPSNFPMHEEAKYSQQCLKSTS